MTPVPDAPDTIFISLGNECPVQKWGKKPNNFNGAFLSGTSAAALPCPGTNF
jgi:hypothetical protein